MDNNLELVSDQIYHIEQKGSIFNVVRRLDQVIMAQTPDLKTANAALIFLDMCVRFKRNLSH